MKIKINDTFYIKDGVGDTAILCEVKVSEKTGAKSEHNLSYHSTVEKAVEAYIRVTAVRNTSEDATLKDFLDEQRKLHDELRSILED